MIFGKRRGKLFEKGADAFICFTVIEKLQRLLYTELAIGDQSVSDHHGSTKSTAGRGKRGFQTLFSLFALRVR